MEQDVIRDIIVGGANAGRWQGMPFFINRWEY